MHQHYYSLGVPCDMESLCKAELRLVLVHSMTSHHYTHTPIVRSNQLEYNPNYIKYAWTVPTMMVVSPHSSENKLVDADYLRAEGSFLGVNPIPFVLTSVILP